MEKNIVIIEVGQGSVKSVCSNNGDIEYLIIDWDNIEGGWNFPTKDDLEKVDSIFSDIEKYLDQVLDDSPYYRKNKTIEDNPESLKEYFESKGFEVDFGDDYAGLSIITNGGIDMLIELQPFNKKSFIEYVHNFDIDDEIDYIRSGGYKTYNRKFKIRELLKDFEEFKLMLDSIVKKLK